MKATKTAKKASGAGRKKTTNNHINRLAKLTMNEKNANKGVAARFFVGDQVIVVEAIFETWKA